jgi:hypothetical protein
MYSIAKRHNRNRQPQEPKHAPLQALSLRWSKFQMGWKASSGKLGKKTLKNKQKFFFFIFLFVIFLFIKSKTAPRHSQRNGHRDLFFRKIVSQVQ